MKTLTWLDQHQSRRTVRELGVVRLSVRARPAAGTVTGSCFERGEDISKKNCEYEIRVQKHIHNPNDATLALPSLFCRQSHAEKPTRWSWELILWEGKQLRIALFTGNYNYIKDGVALTLNRVVDFLRARDVPVLVFAPSVDCPALPSTAEIVRIPSFPIPGRPEYRFATGLPALARRRLAAFRPTLFHIAVPDLLGLQALKLSQRWRVPVLATYHTRYDEYLGYYGLGALKPLGKTYLRYFYSRCELVCPPSESMLQNLQSEGIIRQGRVWSRGVESELYHPRNRSQEWRRSLGFTDGDTVITYAGRLVKEKEHCFAGSGAAEPWRQRPQHSCFDRWRWTGAGPAAILMSFRSIRRLSQWRGPGLRLCFIRHLLFSERDGKLRQCDTRSHGKRPASRLCRCHGKSFACYRRHDRLSRACWRSGGLCRSPGIAKCTACGAGKNGSRRSRTRLEFRMDGPFARPIRKLYGGSGTTSRTQFWNSLLNTIGSIESWYTYECVRSVY